MKKVYSFIALMLLFFVTTAQAQRDWTVAQESTTEIKPNQDYVLQEGFNTAGWSSNGYLNSGDGDVLAEVDESCIYQFIPVEGQTHHELQVYVLKNVMTGKYLAQGDVRYVSAMAKAVKFTVAKAVEKAAESGDPESWDFYHNWTSATACAGAEGANAWVLCGIEGKMYIGFAGNPSWYSYEDTNHWLVKEANEKELSEFDKLGIIFNEYYKNGIEEEYYPVGTNPGCVSQELFNAMKAVYDEANALLGQGENADAAACAKAREDVVASFERYKKEVVPVTAGYYIIVNQRSQDAGIDGGAHMKAAAGKPVPDAWTLENAKYIWEFVATAEKGQFYIKNWGTGKYVGKSKGTSQVYPMVEDSVYKFHADQFQGRLFNIIDQDNRVTHVDGGFNVVVWNDKAAGGGLWRFDFVPAMVMDTLSIKVEQQKLNAKLLALYKDVQSEVSSKKFKNGFTADGEYHGAGLINAFDRCNATESAEGSEAAAFDGNMGSYYHTSWHAETAPADDWHWVQVDLGKEVNGIYLKFSQRHNNRNGNPSRIALVTPTDGDPKEPQWLDTLAKDTVVYQYATNFPQGVIDSTTYIGKFEFEKPVRYLRMAVTRTKANQLYGYGPCWHVSEFRIYDLAETVANPSFAEVPAEVMKQVNDALAAAKAELDNNAATKETYAALEDALEAFIAAYPDATELKEALESATKIAEKTEEGEELGFFQEGAKDELLAVVNEIKAVLDEIEAAGKGLTLAEVQANQKKLDDALAAFYAKMNVPESGKIYRIKSTAGWVLDEEGNRKPDAEGNEQERDQNDAFIASINADYVKGTPVWRYNANDADIDTRFNTLWLVEKDEKGYTFKNLANGLYMANPYEGLTDEDLKDAEIRSNMGYSQTPHHFDLEAYTADFYDAGSFLIKAYKGQFVNLQPTGNVVHWGDRNDAHAPFAFELVEDFNDFYTIDVKAGKAQVLSLPVDLAEVLSVNADPYAYEVVGINNGKLMLNKVAEGEVIKAGTPFVIKTNAPEEGVEGDEGENKISVVLTAADEESQRNLEYNYQPVVVNGMVSAPFEFEIEAGFGTLYNNKLVATEGGETIAAGTGFFNSKLPETSAEGEMVLEIEGSITGEGTAVENAVIVKNEAADVYTISGIKVRSNVKAGAATKGLPKGVYVVGGKKVVVK